MDIYSPVTRPNTEFIPFKSLTALEGIFFIRQKRREKEREQNGEKEEILWTKGGNSGIIVQSCFPLTTETKTERNFIKRK